MRNRFFFLVFSFLAISIVVVSAMQFYFFESERMRLIDQRLEAVASSLIASGLSWDLIENLESTEDLISDLLGEEKVDQIINIYGLDGRILAQNLTATELAVPYEPQVHQHTYDIGDRIIRVFNLRHGNLIIQTGIIMNFDLKRWGLANARVMSFLGIIGVFLIITAYFGSRVLFSPLKKLTFELETMSKQLESRLGQPLNEFTIGPELHRMGKRTHSSKDEFELLCSGFENFLKKLEEYTRSFNAQMAILTHELKTPLTVVKNYLQEARRTSSPAAGGELVGQALTEIDTLAGTINDFLQWSVLVSSPGSPELHAVKLSETVRRIAQRLTVTYANRITIDVQAEATVFALPEHVEQLASNLILNALNYSPENKPVVCQITEREFSVSDQGPGIDPAVLKHLGSPFNRGLRQAAGFRGSGLGLAWVHSLCQKYHWQLKTNTGDSGTKISVTVA